MKGNFMEEIVKKIIKNKFNIDANENTNLSELTEDSFGRIELLFDIEEALKLKIPEGDILDIETFGDLILVLKKLKSNDA